MAGLTDLLLQGTTDASGDLTVNAVSQINGLLYAVEWVFGSGATGVDFVLSCQTLPSGVADTVLTITNADASAVYYPREAEVGSTGSALGTYCYPRLLGTPRLVVSSGGNAKPYSLILYYFK